MHDMKTTQAQRNSARNLAILLDTQASEALHRFFGDNGADLKNELAEALETSVGTITRQCRAGDLPVQIRLLAALKVFEPSLFGSVLDVVGATLGIRWHHHMPGQGSAEDLRSQTALALSASAAAAAGILQDVADGTLDARELATLGDTLELHASASASPVPLRGAAR